MKLNRKELDIRKYCYHKERERERERRIRDEGKTRSMEKVLAWNERVEATVEFSSKQDEKQGVYCLQRIDT